MKQHIVNILILALFSSCSFDQDESFRPESKGIFVLSGQQLYQLTSQGPTLATTEAVSDIALDENEQLWLAYSSSQRVVSQDGAESFSTAPLNPDYIAFAPIHLLIVDRLRNQLGFFHRKKRKLVHQISLENPGPVEVMVDKFYVLAQDSNIHVFLDQAVTETGVVHLPAAVEAMRPGAAEGFLLFTLKGEPLRAARIAYLTEALVEAPFSRRNLSPSQPCNWTDQRFPPFTRAVYGSEWTHAVALCPDSIRSRGIAFGESAEAIAVDFFNSNTFYLKNDSLFAYDMKKKELIGGWPWGGDSLEKARGSF